MTGGDTKIDEIKEKIKTVSGEKRLGIVPVPGYFNVEEQLENIVRKIVEEKDSPVILCNFDQSKEFNILHSLYCNKLKECIRLGFNCVVLIHDKKIEIRKRIPPEKKHLAIDEIKKNILWYKGAGLEDERTEFLTESELWSMIEFEEFANVVTYLGQACNISLEELKKKGENIIPSIISDLCEIYYGYMIKCDIVLVGESDAKEIWGFLKELSEKKILRNYLPPLVMYYPMLKDINGKELTIDYSVNSLSVFDTMTQIENKINSSGYDFLEALFDYIIIPWTISSSEKIELGGKEFSSFKEISNMPKSEICKLAINHINIHFNKVRGADND